MFIFVICIHFVCLYLSVFMNTGPILGSEAMGVIFGTFFRKKRAFCLLTLLKHAIFNYFKKIYFVKTQGNTRLSAIVAPNKHLE